MTAFRQSVEAMIPALRRYARALTGNQKHGDAYVRQALEAIVAAETRQPGLTITEART